MPVGQQPDQEAVEQMAGEDAARFEVEALPYAQDALRDWPDALRVPPQARVFWLVMAAIVAADRWNRRNAPLRAAVPVSPTAANP